ncbi:hypothetical protein K503DRAFT_805997 [Rhizopogon vinicolor AM-OR11-026]|uniref:Uncharacterized protein n=1 Tax=Rhizopogon vinicolor AM-OR11-026 TaxID=1314800 RepID=A0A1B7MG11_9AGAM|nr:hypothetical protein K503DRAFT_805997 [Rhizopogon vinicolor AM-OR11-026]
MPNPPSRMTTRTRNATAHPGLVDVDPKQPQGNGKGKKAAAAEKRQEKKDRREAAVHKIASIEQHMAAKDALDITPGPQAADARAPRKRSQATSRRSQKPLPVSDKNVSDSEMDVDKPESVKHKKKGRETHTDVEENTTDHDTPPKKKARQAKPKIHDSIKSYIKSGEGEESSNGLGSAISKRQAASGRGHHEQDKYFSWEMDEDKLTSLDDLSPITDDEVTPKKQVAVPKLKNKATARALVTNDEDLAAMLPMMKKVVAADKGKLKVTWERPVHGRRSTGKFNQKDQVMKIDKSKK